MNTFQHTLIFYEQLSFGVQESQNRQFLLAKDLAVK